MPALLAARAATDPTRVALVAAGAGELTFAEWEERSSAVSCGLLERGLERGDRVVLLYGNRDWLELAVAYCAVHKAGGVAVPLSDGLAPPEVRHVLADCAAAGVLHGRGLTPPVAGCWAATVAGLEGGARAPVDVAARPEDVAQILYTSGTTGRPKGVSASHANLTFGATADPRRRQLAHSEHAVHAFPVGTNAAQTMLINALDARPAAVTLPRFTPGQFARLIESYAAGTVFVVPAMAIELLNAGAHERYDLSSVLLLGSTGAPLAPAVATRLCAACPNAAVVNYYTSTEAAPAQTIMVFDPQRPSALGKPAAGELKIARGDGTATPPGEVGEIWLRSSAPPRAYHGDQQASQETFSGAWVRMGDLGYLDGEGYLYLVDRHSDVIKCGAFKVSTLQVEAACSEHPAVAEAAAFGIPHPVMGMAVAVAVVPRAQVSPRELRAYLIDRLAPHELPTRVLLCDSLPRSHAGKVLKRELRTLAAGRTEV